MYNVLFVPGQAPQPVLALGLLAANTRRAYKDPVNLAAERVLNELQYGILFGDIDTQLFGSVLICFDSQARYERTLAKSQNKV